MSPPILTVSSSDTNGQLVQVNLLPCRIHHDGDLETLEPYWNPTRGDDGLVKAYIRGRKLHGKTVKLPEGYCGSVVEKGGTRTVVPEADGVQGDDAEAEELSEAIEIAPLSSIAKFDEFVIWGHESTADSGDPYLRSIEEWVSFSEQLHSFSTPDIKLK